MNPGFEALFGAANVSCPDDSRGDCSYTPQNITLPARAWQRFSFSARCRFQPDHTGYHGAGQYQDLE